MSKNETGTANTRNKFATVSVDVENMAVTWNFANGDTQVVNVSEIPEANRNMALLFGVKTKLQNGYAIPKAAIQGALDKGEFETEDAMKAQGFQDAVAQIMSGEWREKAEGTAGSGSVSMVAQAIVNLLEAGGEDVDSDRVASIRGKVNTAEKRKAALANPAIDAEYQKLRLAAMQAKADAASAAAESADTDLSEF